MNQSRNGEVVAPKGWEKISLGALFDFQNGVNADKEAYGAGTPFINVLEVITHTHLDLAKIPGRITLPPSSLEAYVVRRGDILFNRTSETQGEVGLAAVFTGNEPVVFGGFVIRARPKTQMLDIDFSSYLLRSRLVHDQIVSRGQGAVRANIGQRDLSQVYAFLPPMLEQTKIASFLLDMDAHIDSLQHLLTKKRAVMQGVMQEFLTSKRRLSGFTGEWVSVKLGAHTRFKTGPFGAALHQSDYVDGGIPVVNPMQIVDGRIKATHSMSVSESAARRLVEFRLASGDVVIGRRGDMGRCAVVGSVEDGWLCGTGSMIIHPDESLDAAFLQRCISSAEVVKALENASIGSTMNNLNQSVLGNLDLYVPPTKEEQKAIAAVLNDMDMEIETLQKSAAKAIDIRQGMMRELLTGRVRLA